MEKNKSQIILLDKNWCWALGDNGGLQIAGGVEAPSTSTGGQGSAPQLTLAQGNMRPVTQVSATGGSANTASSNTVKASKQPKIVAEDKLHVTTITELGKKLVAASKAGDINLVRKLMAVGAPFISDGIIGMTPLHCAAQHGHYEICERLLCAGLNKDARNKVDKTALHLAATEGHLEIVSLLITSKADIDACDMLKMTALHWACDRGHASIVRLLLMNNARTDIANKFNKAPLHLAIENDDKEIMSLLNGDLSPEGEVEKEQEEAVAVDSISLDMIHDPVVCKTEEVITEEEEEEEVDEELLEEITIKQHDMVQEDEEEEETISNFGNDFKHSIISEDDGDDQNTSVLATLAELAEATSRNGGGENCVADLSSVAALELLKAQAALMPIDDNSALVTSAVAHGQTLQLTEAGRQALKLMKQEPILLPSSPLPQERVEEMDVQNCDMSSRDGVIPQSQSESAVVAASGTTCLPSLLNSESEDKPQEENHTHEQLMQVITLSPEQYAALTGKNGPVILQVVSNDGEDGLSDLDTGQSQTLVQRQKVMHLVTRTGPSSLVKGQAIAHVSGEVLTVDLSGTSTL